MNSDTKPIIEKVVSQLAQLRFVLIEFITDFSKNYTKQNPYNLDGVLIYSDSDKVCVSYNDTIIPIQEVPLESLVTVARYIE